MTHTPNNPTPAPRGLTCEQWEILLADAVDGTLAPAEQLAFDRHAAECSSCNILFEETRRGHEWMGMLDREPAVPAGLMERILTSTTGTQTTMAGFSAPLAVPHQPAVVPFPAAGRWGRYAERRLMMTAAMAFFSIALTLNLIGVHPSAMHWSDLRPDAIRSSVQNQFYAASRPVVRYYENLRFVYELESRLREYRRDSELQQQQQQQQQSQPSAGPTGSSRKGSSEQRPKESPATRPQQVESDGPRAYTPVAVADSAIAGSLSCHVRTTKVLAGVAVRATQAKRSLV